jgi:hypothetical protein
MTKEISLTQGKVALVDDDMFDYLNQWKWQAARAKTGRWYAVRADGQRPNRKRVLMHRVVVNAPEGVDVDHKKQEETLNNQRSNLRLCSSSQNAWNVGKRPNNASGYKGVHWSDFKERWVVTIGALNKRIYVGSFIDKENAAIAYDNAAKFYHGEFASLNFPDQDRAIQHDLEPISHSRILKR